MNIFNFIKYLTFLFFFIICELNIATSVSDLEYKELENSDKKNPVVIYFSGEKKEDEIFLKSVPEIIENTTSPMIKTYSYPIPNLDITRVEVLNDSDADKVKIDYVGKESEKNIPQKSVTLKFTLPSNVPKAKYTVKLYGISTV